MQRRRVWNSIPTCSKPEPDLETVLLQNKSNNLGICEPDCCDDFSRNFTDVHFFVTKQCFVTKTSGAKIIGARATRTMVD